MSDLTDLDASTASGDPTGEPSLHAAIDIGTNSFHLVVAQADPEGGFDVLTTEKEMVRLGSGAHEMKTLQPDAIERGVSALQRMAKVAQSFGAVDLVAVATSAVREAGNGAEFIDRARDEAGVRVEVIAGTEEARLIHLGVLQALPVFDQRRLVVDIGGGSTELVVGEGGDVVEARSMKLGSIRLTQRFFADGIMTKNSIAKARRYVRSSLASVAREFGELEPEIAIGASGTISTVAAMAAAARGEEPRSINGVSFTDEELTALVRTVAKTDPEDRGDIPGMDARRVDIIAGGIVLLAEIFQSLGITEMTVSGYALREGVLLDRFGGSRNAGMARLVDLRRANVERLSRQLDPDPAHAETCARLAVQLFDNTSVLHGLGPEDRELLCYGALLHNVGLFVSHSSHHKHGFYVIANSDQLTGFSQQEILIIALIARYHRRGRPKSRHEAYGALGKDDQRRVRILAGLLRIAIGLDRGHRNTVVAVRVLNEAEGLVVVEAVPRDPDMQLELEIHAAADRSRLLADALDVPITVRRSRPVAC